jgi:hypothetical protein
MNIGIDAEIIPTEVHNLPKVIGFLLDMLSPNRLSSRYINIATTLIHQKNAGTTAKTCPKRNENESNGEVTKR